MASFSKNSVRVLAAAVGAVSALSSLLFRRRQAGRDTRNQERFLRDLIDNAADAFFVHDPDGKILDCNRTAYESLGYTPEELLALSVEDIEEDLSPGRMRRLWNRMEPGAPLEIEGVQRRKDGSTFPVEVRIGLLEKAGDRLMFAVARNVTERKKTEKALHEGEERFRQLFENLGDAFFIHDLQGRILDCNTEACEALGYAREELLGLKVSDVTARMLSEEEKEVRQGETLWERVMRGEPGRIVGFEHNELRRKDGSTFPVEVGVGSILYGGEREIFAAARDITARVELEGRLRFEALHDQLTKLPNRALFTDRLEHAIAQSRRDEGSVAVLFLDLDGFKNVNDTLGHEAGDQLLISFGRRLRSSVRDADTVSRLAGDEFTVLLERLNDGAEAVRVVERILKNLEEPFRVKGRRVPVTSSIGISYGDPATDPARLLDRADKAMYQAKNNGGGRYEIYRPLPENV